MRLNNLLELGDDAAVLLVVVWLADSNMIDSEADEGFCSRFVVGFAADVHGPVGHGDKVDDDVEGWQADVGVEGEDVAGEGLF